MRHPDSEGETQFAIIVFIFSVNYVYDECLYVYSTCDTTIHVYFDYVYITTYLFFPLFCHYYLSFNILYFMYIWKFFSIQIARILGFHN